MEEMDDLELDFLQSTSAPTVVNGTEDNFNSKSPHSNTFDVDALDFELNSTTISAIDNSTIASTFISDTEVDDIFGSPSKEETPHKSSVATSTSAIDDPFAEFDSVSPTNTTTLLASDSFDDIFMNGNSAIGHTAAVNEEHSSSSSKQEEDIFGTTMTETESIPSPPIAIVEEEIDTNQLESSPPLTQPAVTSHEELNGFGTTMGKVSSMFDELDLGETISNRSVESILQVNLSVGDTATQITESKEQASTLSAVQTAPEDDFFSQPSESYVPNVPPTFTSSNSLDPFGNPIENRYVSADSSDPFSEFETTKSSNIVECKNGNNLTEEIPPQPTEYSSFVETSETKANFFISSEFSTIENAIQEEVPVRVKSFSTIDYAPENPSSLLETTKRNEEVSSSTSQVDIGSQHIGGESDRSLAPIFSGSPEEIFSSYGNIEEFAPYDPHQSHFDPVDPPGKVESEVVQTTSEMTEISLQTSKYSSEVETKAEDSSDVTADGLNASPLVTSSFDEQQVAKNVETFDLESKDQQLLPPIESFFLEQTTKENTENFGSIHQPTIEQHEDFVPEPAATASSGSNSGRANATYELDSTAMDSLTAPGFHYINTVTSTTTATSRSSMTVPFESTMTNNSNSFETIEDVETMEKAVDTNVSHVNDNPFGDFAAASFISNTLETDPHDTLEDLGDFNMTNTVIDNASSAMILVPQVVSSSNENHHEDNPFGDSATASSVNSAIEADPDHFDDLISTKSTLIDDAGTETLPSSDAFCDFVCSNVDGPDVMVAEKRKDDVGDFGSVGSLPIDTSSLSDDFGYFLSASTVANESMGIASCQESDEFGDFGTSRATEESLGFGIERQSSDDEFGGFSSAPPTGTGGFELERQSSDEFGNFGSASNFSSSTTEDNNSTGEIVDFQKSTSTFEDFGSFEKSSANSEVTRKHSSLSDDFGDFSTASTSNEAEFESNVPPPAPTSGFNHEIPLVFDAEKIGLFFSKAFPVESMENDTAINAFQAEVNTSSPLEGSGNNNNININNEDRMERLSKAFGSLYLKAFEKMSDTNTKDQKTTTNIQKDTRQQRIRQLKYVLKEKIQEACQNNSSVFSEGSSEYTMMNQLLEETCEDEQLILKAIMNVQNLLFNHAVHEAMMRIAKQAAMSAKAKIAEMTAQQHSSTRASLLHPFHTTRQLLTSRSSEKDHVTASHGVMTPTGASMGKISRFSFNGTTGNNGSCSSVTGSGSVSSDHEASSGDEHSGAESRSSGRVDRSGYDSDPTSSASSSTNKGGSGGFMKKFITSLSGTRYKTQTRMVSLRRMGESGEEVRKMELNMEQISGGFDEVKWKCAQFVYDTEEVASVAPAQIRILSYPMNEVLSSKSERGVLLKFLKPGTIWTIDIGKISDE
jgi:hypothetical protein